MTSMVLLALLVAGVLYQTATMRCITPPKGHPPLTANRYSDYPSLSSGPHFR